MRDVNEYFARQCGVELYTAKEINEHGNYWYDGSEHQYEFTIEDPRCREVCRERFAVDTCEYGDHWEATGASRPSQSIPIIGRGKTIAEAEINCLIAIYNREVEDK
jgi:hypothetical protein